MATDEERRQAERLREALLEEIRVFFEKQIALAPAAAAGATDRRIQLATAALLLSIVRADHEIRQDEHNALRRAVESVLGLPSDAALRIIRLAEEDASRLVPLPEFVRQIAESHSYEQKKRLLEGLWRVAYADAELAAHEEYVVRKVADLLGLSTADLIETKVAAREGFLRDDL